MPDQTSESPTGGNRQGFQKSTNLAKKGIDMDNMSCGDEEFKGSLAPVGRQPLTMSSREIADLTNKEHKNVLRDIRVMLDGLKIEPVTFAGSYLDAKGERRECFNLPKRESLILVSGYSVELRARIIDRWMELEARASLDPVALGLPDFNNPISAAEAWIEVKKSEKAARVALEEAAPKVDAYEYFIGSRQEGMNLQRAMKILGYGPNKAIAVLREAGILYGTPPTPRQYYRDMGYFVMLPVEDRHTAGKVRPQTFVTPKGLDWLRKKLPEIMGDRRAA